MGRSLITGLVVQFRLPFYAPLRRDTETGFGWSPQHVAQ